MGYSTHIVEERKARLHAIKKIGLGTVVFSTVIYDVKREKNFIYEISSTAILTVRAYDEPTLIVTRYPARPSRIRKYWAEATEEVIQIAIKHTQMGYTF